MIKTRQHRTGERQAGGDRRDPGLAADPRGVRPADPRRLVAFVPQRDAWRLSSRRASSASKTTAAALADPRFWESIRTTVLLTVLGLLVQMPLGVLLAVMLERNLRGARLFRTILIIPMLLTPVAVGLMWRFMFDTDLGVINWAHRTVRRQRSQLARRALARDLGGGDRRQLAVDPLHHADHARRSRRTAQGTARGRGHRRGQRACRSSST